MKTIFRVLKKIIIPLGQLFSLFIRKVYLMYYPLNPDFENNLTEVYKSKQAKSIRVNQINRARVNSVVATLWSHAGTVFALALTIYSIIFSIALYCVEEWDLSLLIVLGIVILIPPFFTILLTPVLLKRIIDYLPSDTYASLSLSNLNQSEVLTFVAIECWEMCNKFIKKIVIASDIKALVNANNEEAFSKVFENYDKAKWIESFKSLNSFAITYKANKYKKIENAKALKNEAVLKLNILPVEFCHHILKFSPSIFEARLNALIHSSESLIYLLESGDFALKDNYFSFKETLHEISSIIDDIELRRKRSLFQISTFEKTHGYIIGLASVTSTSQSLKVFIRGLSELIDNPGYENNIYNEKYVYEPFRSLLHRSKAHYGFDLLITLENFYNKNYSEKEKIPKILFDIKHNSNEVITTQTKSLLKHMREDMVKKYSKAMNKIAINFGKQIESIQRSLDGNVYLFIFGYSKIVRNALLMNQDAIIKKEIKVFVMKEFNKEMLDTRMLRFELNDSKKNKIRYTFTGSDDLFKRLLRKNDTLIMMAGAEAYDLSGKRLFHTNNYQKRVENFLDFLNHNVDKKPQPQVWIVAGGYKIYEKFPHLDSTQKSYKGEFFADHYDKLDIYNFEDFNLNPILITE